MIIFIHFLVWSGPKKHSIRVASACAWWSQLFNWKQELGQRRGYPRNACVLCPQELPEENKPFNLAVKTLIIIHPKPFLQYFHSISGSFAIYFIPPPHCFN